MRLMYNFVGSHNIIYFIMFVIGVQSFLTYDSFAFEQFVRQEISDNGINGLEEYWFDTINGGEVDPQELRYLLESSSIEKKYPYTIDIFSNLSSISYVSDGKSLNSTFWLSSNFTETPPSMSIPTYAILIDVDSNSFTGSSGIDYIAQISWSNKTKDWSYIIQEWSQSKQARFIYEISNYTAFYGNKKIADKYDFSNSGYIHLNLDLKKIGPVDNARAIFLIEYELKIKDQTYRLADFSKWVPLPPPEFTLAMTPNSISLRPEEQKTTLIELQSNSSISPSVLFDLGQTTGLKVNLTSDEISVPSYGIASTHLNIHNMRKVGDVLSEKLPVIASINFPKISFNYNNNTVTFDGDYRNLTTFVDISFLPPLELKDYLNDIWTTIGTPLYGFIGLITAIVVGIAGITKWFLNKSKMKKNKDTGNNNGGIGKA